VSDTGPVDVPVYDKKNKKVLDRSGKQKMKTIMLPMDPCLNFPLESQVGKGPAWARLEKHAKKRVADFENAAEAARKSGNAERYKKMLAKVLLLLLLHVASFSFRVLLTLCPSPFSSSFSSSFPPYYCHYYYYYHFYHYCCCYHY